MSYFLILLQSACKEDQPTGPDEPCQMQLAEQVLMSDYLQSTGSDFFFKKQLSYSAGL